MSVYAPLPAYADHRPHPRALILIVGGHVALLGAVMTAKMDLPLPFVPTPTIVQLLDDQKQPPDNSQPKQPQKHESRLDQPRPLVPAPQPFQPRVDQDPLPFPTIDPGPTLDPGPATTLPPPPRPVRVGPRFATPAADVKPPYPHNKLRMEEEAVLRLRLSIDERGRVTAVEPVGNADPVFLAAARRHLIARWRYQPATEGGQPVATSTVVTLRFQLDQ